MNIEEIKQTIQESFKDLIFDELTHTYTKDSSRLNSVSSIVKTYYNEFKSNEIANICAINHNKSNDIKKTAQDFIKEWNLKGKTAREKGTKIHKFANNYPNFTEPTIDEHYAVIEFYNQLPSNYEVVLLEFPLYSDSYAGTPDKILYNKKTRKLVISDYKTGGDLFKNYKGQKLKEPFTGLLDTPFNRYSIQQSLYKILLESKTPYKVEECWLIHLPDKTYNKYIALDLSHQLKEHNERTICNSL